MNHPNDIIKRLPVWEGSWRHNQSYDNTERRITHRFTNFYEVPTVGPLKVVILSYYYEENLFLDNFTLKITCRDNEVARKYIKEHGLTDQLTDEVEQVFLHETP